MADPDATTAQRSTQRPAKGRPTTQERLAKDTPPAVTLVTLTVTDATQKNVTGAKNWVAVKKSKAYVIIEATTGPNNSPEEWKTITWAGGEPVKGHANRRQV